ncbi:CvpA family protein [Ferruginibacter sp. SUN106]|uniref:CvpA family protein n=1 Tax=Ferruginibacter sp. SUN106 TaxID=2978348 RepID=UPI003D36B0FF
MTIADIILIVVVILFTWLGYRRGFINSFFDLVKWTGALTIAALFYAGAADLLEQNFSMQQEWEKPISFVVLFIVSLFFLTLIFIFVKKIVTPSAQQSFANKITGLIPGFLTGVVVSVLLAKIFTASVWFATPGKDNSNLLVSSLANSTGWLDDRMDTIFNAPPAPTIAAASETLYSESEEFKCANFNARPDLEEQMLHMVNAERKTRGLKILAADGKLQLAAHSHAADMFTRGYFSHITPDGINPFERMKKIAIKYNAAGENLAHSNGLEAAHTGLMNSQGHRDNILNKQFGKIGISILDGGLKGLMVVQEFSN